MQSSQSSTGQVAAAIAAAAAANRGPAHSPARIAHGHEENEPAPHESVAHLLGRLTGKPSVTETADTPS
jgi:hypothetical protein